MILITAYQQTKMTRDNIINFRKEFNGYFSKCPIVIVTTSETEVGFSKLQNEFDDVHVINFNDAPGSSSCSWYTFKCPNAGPINWKHEFIPPRIFMSMEKGLHKALELGYNKVLHLHSDTFWMGSHETNLNELFEESDDYMLTADRSILDCGSGPLPEGLHFHPEGMFFNLEKCQQHNDYGLSFSKMFTDEIDFMSHNYYAPSALIGQYALWCITGINMLDDSEEIPQAYWDNVKINIDRSYHGTFSHGMLNFKGCQPYGQ